jgi:hypothetical protein
MKQSLLLLTIIFGAFQAEAAEIREYYTEALTATLDQALNLNRQETFKIVRQGVTPAGESCALNVEQKLEQFGSVAMYTVTVQNLKNQKSATVSFGSDLAGASASPESGLKYVEKFEENLPEISIKLAQKDLSESFLDFWGSRVETIKISDKKDQTRVVAGSSPAGLKSLWSSEEIICDIAKPQSVLMTKQASVN